MNNNMKLLNQNGSWVHQEKAWTLTAEGSEGNIEDQLSGKVLGLLNNGTEIGTPVILESKKRSVCSEGQKWLRDAADEGGWFRLKNPLSGRVLTAQDQTIISIAGTLSIILKECFWIPPYLKLAILKIFVSISYDLFLLHNCLSIVLSTDCDNDFFEQCLNICLLQKEKFIPFLLYIEGLIKTEIFQFFNMNGFYEFLMTRTLDLKLVEHLQLLLDHFVISSRKLARAHNEKHTFFRNNLKVNSKFLLAACAQGSLDMIKVFIKNRCHLTIAPELEKDMDWTKLSNPLLCLVVQPKPSNVLLILKMMATKAYIFGCYQAMIETKGIKDCQCKLHVMARPRGYEQDTWRSEAIFFQETVSKISTVKKYHECPASDDFMPNSMDCEDHVECNDPISRYESSVFEIIK